MKKTLAMLCLTVGIFATALSVGMAADKPEKGDKKPDPEMVFKRMDKNKDDSLSVEEFVGKREGEKADKAKEQFKKLDKDKDGKVSKKEFLERGKKKAK